MFLVPELSSEPLQIFLWIAYIFAVTVVVTVVRSRRKLDLPVRDVTKGHRWYEVEIFPRPTFCSVCEEHIMEGAHCDSCGICTDEGCVHAADKLFPCKRLSLPGRTSMDHVWARGNLPLCSVCFVCGVQCGTNPTLCDRRCMWCQRTVHDCCAVEDNRCDFGHYRSMIIPPYSVGLQLVGIRGRRHLSVSKLYPPVRISNWSPLMVFANPSSGNNMGEHLLREFREVLNPIQVIDLHSLSPVAGLELCRLLPTYKCRLLVCGGDGTVGWVLGALDRVKLQNQPLIGVLPLGTGNDLARVLGWGEGFVGEKSLDEILTDIAHAEVTPFDRWTVSIIHQRLFGIRRPAKVLAMNNYFSMGCDALVALNFHRQRQTRPELFTSRLFNKFWYFSYGAIDVLEQACVDLHERVKLELDGRTVHLPELEGIVVLNISSWAGGFNLWSGTGEEDVPPASFNDGILEVVGLHSSFHMGQVRIAMADPIRLGQARVVKLTLQKGTKMPVQVDGEPWEQGSATITISLRNRVNMLKKSEHHE
ncbi:diacylglycerol kinase epsilon-like [Branchiostoma floridae]|uniref:Diacylglycerol kinase n=1 Tax=Branchiostoma floridae TaxID=7739 RepID=A0A9J7M6A3_BRAFL|nr:diacylglycerol kinase epsilon-like [Branchiostoma floridae]